MIIVFLQLINGTQLEGVLEEAMEPIDAEVSASSLSLHSYKSSAGSSSWLFSSIDGGNRPSGPYLLAILLLINPTHLLLL